MFFKRASKSELNDNAASPKPAITSIASGTECNGNLATDGEVHVDGTVNGHINAHVCLVSANGVVAGEISADEIIVCGRITGPLRAYHVHLQSGARIDGDVISDTIAVDSGAILNGSVHRSEDPFESGAVAAPVKLERDRSSFLDSPLWIGSDADSQRPLTAIRPK